LGKSISAQSRRDGRSAARRVRVCIRRAASRARRRYRQGPGRAIVPRKLLEKLLRRHRNELAMQAKLRNVYQYRKQVLAIFDELVTRERTKERVH